MKQEIKKNSFFSNERLQQHEDERIEFEEKVINMVSELTGMTYGDVQDMEGLETAMYEGWIQHHTPEDTAAIFCEELDNQHPTRQ